MLLYIEHVKRRLNVLARCKIAFHDGKALLDRIELTLGQRPSAVPPSGATKENTVERTTDDIPSLGMLDEHLRLCGSKHCPSLLRNHEVSEDHE